MRSRRKPALLTRVSSRPYVSRAVRTREAAPSVVAMSPPCAIASPPCGADLLDDPGGRAVAVRCAVESDAEVVDDHTGALGGVGERVRAAEATPRPGHDDDAPFAEPVRATAHRGFPFSSSSWAVGCTWSAAVCPPVWRRLSLVVRRLSLVGRRRVQEGRAFAAAVDEEGGAGDVGGRVGGEEDGRVTDVGGGGEAAQRDRAGHGRDAVVVAVVEVGEFRADHAERPGC